MSASWYRSPEWERIAKVAEEWRVEASDFADNPTTYVPKEHLGSLAFDLVCSCDEHGVMDTSLLLDFSHQADLYQGKSTLGVKLSKKHIEALLLRCANIVDRLIIMSCAESEPSTAADPPPEALLVDLTGQQRKIVGLLWQKPVLTETVVKAVWPNPCNPETPWKGIDRLNQKFLDLRKDYTVRHKGEYLTLDKPDKK